MEMMEFVDIVHNEIARLTGNKDNRMRFTMDVASPLQERGKVKEIYNFSLDNCHLIDLTDIWHFSHRHVGPSMFNYSDPESTYLNHFEANPETELLQKGYRLPERFDGKVSNDVRMPFDKPTLLFTEHSDIMNHKLDDRMAGGWSAYVIFHRKNAPVEGQFVVFTISWDSHGLTETQLCLLAPNGKYIPTWKDRSSSSDTRKTELFFNVKSYELAAALATMNSPRHVTFVPAANRAKRKLAHRGMGTAMDAMHRVAWDIDKPVKAKTPHDETFHKMPYHYRRGYWRRCDKDNPRSERRLQAPKYRDRFLWWMWIDGYWAGHPAFGIKKQYWQPRKKKETA